MSVYISCAYESDYKGLARDIFTDLNNANIPTFFTGDISDDIRYEMMKPISAALDQAAVLIPIICGAYERDRFCQSELAYAFEREKWVVPVLVQRCVTIGGLLKGTMIRDVSSSAKYKAELPEMIKTIRPLIPEIVVARGKKSGGTGSAAGDKDAQASVEPSS